MATLKTVEVRPSALGMTHVVVFAVVAVAKGSISRSQFRVPPAGAMLMVALAVSESEGPPLLPSSSMVSVSDAADEKPGEAALSI